MTNSDETQEEYLENLFSQLRSRIQFLKEYDYSIPGLRAGLEVCLANPQRDRLSREFAYLLQFAYVATNKTSEARAVRDLLPKSNDSFIECTTEAVSMAVRNELDKSVLYALLHSAADRNSVLSAIKVFSQMAFFFDLRNDVIPKSYYLAEVSLCQVFPKRKSTLRWDVPRIKLQETGFTKVKMIDEIDRNKCVIEERIRSFWADEDSQIGEVKVQLKKTDVGLVLAKPPIGSSCLIGLLARLRVSRGGFTHVDNELKLVDDEFNICPVKETELRTEGFVKYVCNDSRLSETLGDTPNGEVFEIHLYDNLIYDPLYYPNKRLNHFQQKILEERKKKER